MKVDYELACTFAKELISDLKNNPELTLTLVEWVMLESLLIIKIQEMKIDDVYNQDALTDVVHKSLEFMISGNKEDEFSDILNTLLDNNIVEMIITEDGNIGYRWKK